MMKQSLNQLKKDYNNSLRNIPESELADVFYELFYDSYYDLFMEKDDLKANKNLSAIEILIDSNRTSKIFKPLITGFLKATNIFMVDMYWRHNKASDSMADMFNEILSQQYKTINTLIDTYKNENALNELRIDYEPIETVTENI